MLRTCATSRTSALPVDSSCSITSLRTARANARRRGIVQGYTVLTGESVTENHPASDWVRERYRVLRDDIATALRHGRWRMARSTVGQRYSRPARSSG